MPLYICVCIGKKEKRKNLGWRHAYVGEHFDDVSHVVFGIVLKRTNVKAFARIHGQPSAQLFVVY